MTQEEKAKRYDEAIKLAKDSYNYPSYPGFIRADVVFPELKESKDERIRKAIHIYLDWLDGRNKDYQPKGDYSIKDMIAWLEKQGEQKSQRMISAEAKEAMYDNPAWSEKDEQHIDSLLKRLDGLCRNEFERTRFAISEDRDWLKSLKERIE